MDLSNANITFPCPDCEFQNEATLGAMTEGGSVICVGCLKTIEFVDEDGSSKRAINEANQSLNDLRRSLNGN